MKFYQKSILVLAVLCSLAITSSLHAQETEGDLAQKSDQTGTNPINFTYDARLYNEYQWLNVPGDGGQNITTFEFRAPFADGKWQFRTRLRATHLDIDRAGVDEFGLGDMDMRFLTVPYLSIEDLLAVAVGVEIFLPTGSDDLLSSNALSLGPQMFVAFFAPFGGLVDLIAPGYQHQFSVYEESGARQIHQSNLDLFILKTFNKKQQWILINAQGFINYETDRETFVLDTEAGTMLDAILGTKGHSIYVRPSVGLSGKRDRPYDVSIEGGYKIVW